VLILSNEDVESVLTMADAMAALEDAYREEAEGRAVNQLRYDTNMPLPERLEREARFEFKTMVGILPKAGVAALRMSSTLNHRPIRYGVVRAERLRTAPGGTMVGLVQLYSTETGEPLAFMPDGVMQGTRVGATFGLAVKHLARPDADTVGMLGSGHQACYQVASVALARNITHIKVYSPNAEHRTRFAQEMTDAYGVEIQAVDTAEEAVRDVDILLSVTNARERIVKGEWVRPGMHVSAVTMELADEALARADVLVSHVERNFLMYEGGPGKGQYGRELDHGEGGYGGNPDGTPSVLLEDVIAGKHPGRTSPEQVTMYRGHGLGLQFAAVGALIYNRARERGLGHEIPTDWFTQTYHT
jgi:alanine dehydrogenase